MQSYQLYIHLSQDAEIQIGKLGSFTFCKGTYIYTGSAKRNIESRIRRHFSENKKLHWHIDYLLDNDNTSIIKSVKSVIDECNLNSSIKGKIAVQGFGSSDCKNKCQSHLRLVN